MRFVVGFIVGVALGVALGALIFPRLQGEGPYRYGPSVAPEQGQ